MNNEKLKEWEWKTPQRKNQLKEWSLVELEEILKIPQQLSDLQKHVKETNRRKADWSLAELEETLKIQINKSEQSESIPEKEVPPNNPTHDSINIHDPLNQLDKNHQDSSKDRWTPIGITWAITWTKESIVTIGKSIAKLGIDLLLLPNDIYSHFKKDKKIG